MSRVTTHIENHIAHVTLTRADKHNAMDHQMMEEIIKAGRALLNTDARAVLLSGAGPSFCAGLDVMSFASLAAGNPKDLLMPRTHGTTNMFQEVTMIWRRVPVPVIAALHGATYGAGFQLTLGADIRIAQPDTKLAIMEMKWGLVPDMGAMAILPGLTRSDVIRKLTYTATPIKAPQAEQWGLVTELANDPMTSALTLAQDIAGKSPSAMRMAKSLITAAETGLPEAETLLRESEAQADLIGQPDQMEAVGANMAGRAPEF